MNLGTNSKLLQKLTAKYLFLFWIPLLDTTFHFTNFVVNKLRLEVTLINRFYFIGSHFTPI